MAEYIIISSSKLRREILKMHYIKLIEIKVNLHQFI